MDSFEINKIIGAILLVALLIIGIGKISASMGAIGLLMQPITATLLAAYFFNELLNIMQIIFIFVSLLGIYIAKINTK